MTTAINSRARPERWKVHLGAQGRMEQGIQTVQQGNSGWPEEVEKHAPREVSQLRARTVEDIYRKFPRDAGTKAELISPDVVEQPGAQYQADLAKLRARYQEIGSDE